MPFFIGAVVSLVTISLSFFLLPESLTAERRQRDASGECCRNELEEAAASARGCGLVGHAAF